MNSFFAGEVQKTLMLGLQGGEDILKSIKTAVKEKDIRNGVVVSGVGSLKKARFHTVVPGKDKEWEDKFIEKEGIIEVVSIQGIIADYEPHLHIMMLEEGETLGGHLEEGCTILTLAEIVIAEVEEELTREMGDEGFSYLNIKLN